jgi:hypothetical protein
MLWVSTTLVISGALIACGGSSASPTSASPTPTPVTASSCPGGTQSKGTMSAVINGTAWSTTCVTTASGPGTFSMSSGAANALVNLLPASAAAWTANVTGGSGTITLTALSQTGASGTFSFTAVPLAGTGATGNKVVTGGVFSVTF